MSLDFDWLQLFYKWIFNRKYRLHLTGFRPEVICFIQSTDSEKNHLLVQPQSDRSIWMPPQEGMDLEETLKASSMRCLNTELGLTESEVQFRRSIWVGKRLFPSYRKDERDLSYSLRGWVDKNRMIGKAYFAALIIVDSQAVIQPNPAEIYQYQWVSASKFLQQIKTNPPEKQKILCQAWVKLVILPQIQ
ncbi:MULTISPECIES: NUDIX domain-containing protein [unclassified Coleofasciculus]|uniref:NUDIX domain-containing protein n=1 Tax=unclassified Coleofasciculus TaxID=2692782 RepID=UPI0018828EA6|nr:MULTISPECIES: NUDIX domain-containing protein [unclassified Coleofasciculus]MBE9127475.1 NUDIX domain-containing protein [Coleofasciculus sp. LEGE 07081]MBE9150747.1 NUDIX domain-containing protein [Coleofasciculus sp. LEGE 07092]